MKIRTLVWVVAGCGVLSACSGGDGDDGKEMPLDPDVEPVTNGAWYRPVATTTWQWQLMGEVNTVYDVGVYDIDLFDSPRELIERLHAEGRKVICYFSAGSSEDWRADFDRFDPGDIGHKLDQWEGENWVDIRSPDVHAIMHDRLDLAVEKGCDGVEPDNVDAYEHNSGFDLSARDQLAYNRHMANQARQRGLAVGLKNDCLQAGDLVDYYDFALNEQCHEFQECDLLAPFAGAGKPVFNAEYAKDARAAAEKAATVCPLAHTAGLRTLVLHLDLDDSIRVSCDD